MLYWGSTVANIILYGLSTDHLVEVLLLFNTLGGTAKPNQQLNIYGPEWATEFLNWLWSGTAYVWYSCPRPGNTRLTPWPELTQHLGVSRKQKYRSYWSKKVFANDHNDSSEII